MSSLFVPDDFEMPLELATDRLRLERLGPEHNERDHEAWTSRITHIRAAPGFSDGKWPTEMSTEQNLVDLVRVRASRAELDVVLWETVSW